MLVPRLKGGRLDEAGSATAAPLRRAGRRDFFKTFGAAGAMLALAPRLVLAEPEPVGGEAYRGCVAGFVDVICKDNPDTANWIKEQIWSARLAYSPRNDDLHYLYASAYVFLNTRIDRAEVICRNGFMVTQFPYYGVDCSCPSLNDLNVPEMRRLTDGNEVSFYKCVLAPKGERMPLEENDHADYRRTIDNYSHDPNHWEPVYKREVVAKKSGRTYRAYGLAHKTETDVNGKRKGDVIVSSYDI